MAHDYLIPSVIPATSPVIPATPPVIHEKAGIQPHYEEQRLFSAALDTRLRGYDGIEGGTGAVDAARAPRFNLPVVPVAPSVIPATPPVIPVTPSVIPAKAGIQPHYEQLRSPSAALDTRVRGYDGIEGGAGAVDAAETGGAGV